MLSDRGRMLGKYQLIAEIARGGMGVVYLAMIQGPGGFNKLVVVKELKPELVEDPAFLTMFLDEARLAARLNHPNIVQTNEVGNDGDRYFMAMDYLDGRGLDQVRRRTKIAGFGLSMSMQVRVLCEMLAGLEYAHNLTDFDGSRLDIVHRDVSPQNVFITFEGQIKLLDFGIAKASDSMHETNAGVIKGKVGYMAPEQGRGDKVDARADVFSAGVLLWEALTGKRMREAKNEPEKTWAVLPEDVPRASVVNSSVPPELDRICAQAMAWDRDERYASAGAMQHELERYLLATGRNVSAREVGACVSELFLQDRANTNGMIEAHIARARGGVARETLPIIDVASRLGAGGPTPSDERPFSMSPTEAGQMTSLDVPGAKLAGTSRGASRDSRGVTRAGNARRLIIPGIAVAALAVILLAFVARSGRETGLPSHGDSGPRPAVPQPNPPRQPPPPPMAVTRPPEPVASVARRGVVDVEIHVSPKNARISIDGREVGRSSFTGQYAMDDVVHTVRATAPGHVTRSVEVPFNADVMLDVRLERISSSPVRPARPVARVTPPGRTAQPVRTLENSHTDELAHPPDPSLVRQPSVDPVPTSEPRPIDPNNPYGGRS
jgi:serine/threonine-protein kinase